MVEFKGQDFAILLGKKRRVDGGVEIVAEGNEEQLQDFYNWLKVGPKTASVERVLEDYIENKRYSDFSIIHR